MGHLRQIAPVLPLVVAFSRHAEALEWGLRKAQSYFGAVWQSSPHFPFGHTNYYEATMGDSLVKVLWAFDRLQDPAALTDWKLASNAWEAEYAALGRHQEARPLNLDPGYVTPAKLVLASTKDYAHRIYLRDGIFAEITLHFLRQDWQAHQWTFPDFRAETYHAFLSSCRAELLRRQAAESAAGP